MTVEYLTRNMDHPLSLLAFGTLIGVVVVTAFFFIRFLRRKGVHPMDGQRERNIGEIRDEAGNGSGGRPN